MTTWTQEKLGQIYKEKSAGTIAAITAPHNHTCGARERGVIRPSPSWTRRPGPRACGRARPFSAAPPRPSDLLENGATAACWELHCSGC